jgi:hypothetical protein
VHFDRIPNLVTEKKHVFDLDGMFFLNTGLSGDSKFRITIDCTNSSGALASVCRLIFEYILVSSFLNRLWQTLMPNFHLHTQCQLRTAHLGM